MKSYALMEQYARWESGGAPSGTPTRSGLELAVAYWYDLLVVSGVFGSPHSWL